MKKFMDGDFLLETETAKHLFHDYAENMPLIDYHCHISPKEIYEDRRFENIAQVWLGGKNPDGSYFGDHYKWRLMRANGASEDYITGDKPDYERFVKFTQSLEMAIGNPMIHWCNLELQRFFGYDKPLTLENAKECWDFVNEKLQKDPDLSVRGILRKSKVFMVGTTDDPIDSLQWHKKIAEDETIETKVYPSFRPDKAINISKEGFLSYLEKLANSAEMESISTADEVCKALSKRLEYFSSLGCKASDHGLDYIPFEECSLEEANKILQKALKKEKLTKLENDKYQSFILLHLAKEYHRLGIVMQLHYSCKRNANEKMYCKLGPDTGYDMIAQTDCGEKIADLLSELDKQGKCPKTILYSLNPSDFDQISTLTGCFQSDEIPGKIQHGCAWWFNDTKDGMEKQLHSLANVGLLGNFAGMLTDSRSFLSYPRHEYFRRILCNMIGKIVENGEYPNSENSLKKIVEGISFYNAKRYFEV